MDSDSFFDKCLNEYDDLIEETFDTAPSPEQLEKKHVSIKADMLQELPIKWSEANDATEMPDDVEEKLCLKLETTFAKLKRQFVKSRQREQSNLTSLTVGKDALTYYNDQMDKYFQNHPTASPKEIEMVHAKTNKAALELAKSKVGLESQTQTLHTLKKEIEGRRKVYYNRAKMILKSTKDPAIGIDLGTTMCCVMVFYNGKVEIVPNRSQGSSHTTPSYVAFHEDNTDTFGYVAKEEAYRHPEITIYDAKRMIGRSFYDEKLQSDKGKWPFEVVSSGGNVQIKTGDRLRYPHEVSARLLARFRLMAEDHLHLPRGSITKAVITVPAYFTEPQRRATNEAAVCAGLDVLNILSEPTAATIAYCWERRDKGTRLAFVYDLGGGTFDVSIAKVNAGNVEILCVDGDTHLGGQDFDQLLMEYCITEFKIKNGVDLAAGSHSPEKIKRDEARSALSRIKLQCEQAKERLSTADKTTVQIAGIHRNMHMSVVITKSEMEDLIRPLVQTTFDIVDRVLVAARSKGVASKDAIDDVILVGGSTRIPLVKEMLTSYFGGKQLCMHINPDEAVAYGAAVQAAILNKDDTLKTIKVEDVTPLSLGVETVGHTFSIIIPKNSKIPCQFAEIYVTLVDGQTIFGVQVYQGENLISIENKFLGKFVIKGIPPRPAGEEKAIIKMRIDSMGILQVEAVSLSTRKSNSITITADRMGMDKGTMDRVKKECQDIQTY